MPLYIYTVPVTHIHGAVIEADSEEEALAQAAEIECDLCLSTVQAGPSQLQELPIVILDDKKPVQH